MTVDVTETPLDCVRGDDNIYTIDLDQAIVAGSDKIWFLAKRRRGDADTAAVIKKGLNVSIGGALSGVVVTSEANGIFQVQVAPTDTASVVDQALYYDVQFKAASGGGKVRTVARGVLLLSGEVTQATS